jgi:alanyl-tRNA synthetase
MRYFDQAVQETLNKKKTVIPGATVFKLYDTFGFPLDLSQELAREKSLEVDETGFRCELEEQRNRARQTWKGQESQQEIKVIQALKGLEVKSHAHETSEVPESRILAVLHDERRVERIKEGEEGEIILDRTPFYAEAGGQVGDTGSLKGRGFSAQVLNTAYLGPDIVSHRIKILGGELKEGETVEAVVDVERRRAVSNHHTATHLLHAALRQILGDHVKQAGSLVSPTRLRFDFTHFAALSPEELREIESLVNEKIRENLPVQTRTTTLEEGIKDGAVAIFEEKYGENVRVIGIGDFSKELCGGIHVSRTGDIGFFKILSEASIASGMRRIECVAGDEALRYIQELEKLMDDVGKDLGSSRKEVPAKIEKLKDSLEAAERENRALRKKLAGGGLSGEEERSFIVKDIPVFVRKVEGLPMAELRDMADSLKQKKGSAVVVLGEVEDDKVFVVASVSKDLTGRLQAGALIKEIAPRLGGGGGGRPDFAQAGGTKPEELDRVLEAVPSLVEKLVS